MSDALAVRDVRLFRDRNELLEKYQDVFVQSLMTSFGLDALFFGTTDQAGGTVDTIHNAREGVYSRQYGNEAKYKEHIEEIGPRFNRDAYNKNKDFKEKGRYYKECAKNGTLKDGYTGRTLTPHDKFDREHIISAHEIEKDAGRILAEIDGDVLASADSNLTPLEHSINRSKKQKSVKEYIAWLDANRDQHEARLRELVEKSRQGPLSDKERKQKERLESLRSVDKELMLKRDEEARSGRDRTINLNYYLGEKFLSQTGKEVFRAGWKMGAKQALGLVFMEVWKALRAEWPHIMETWRNQEGWLGKLDIRPVLRHLGAALSNAVAAIRAQWKDVLGSMKDGFLSGALSSLTTTIINIFETTVRRAMQLIRNFWSSIVAAVRIMRSDGYASREEKTLAVMKLLSVGVASIIQPIVAECVDAFLAPYMVGPFAMLREVVSGFAGAFCSGMISVTLVYFIDNSPLVRKLLVGVGDVVVNAVALIGKGIGLTVNMIKNASDNILKILVSPAAQCLKMACSPLMSATTAIQSDLARQGALLARMDGKLDAQTQAMTEANEQLEGLHKLVDEGFADIREAITTQTHILNQLLTEQTRQITDVIENLHQDMKQEFADIRQILEADRQENESLAFHQRMNALLLAYQICVEAAMRPDGVPSRDDLNRVISAAHDLVSWLEARLQGPFRQSGDPRRLPLFSAYVLAVQLEVDTRRFLDGDNAPCEGLRMALSKKLADEVKILSRGTLFELAGKERSFLVEQYVLLHRALKQSVNAAESFQIEGAGTNTAFLASPELFVWNDGLGPIRQVLETVRDDAFAGPEPTLLVEVPGEQKGPWGDGTVSSLKAALGIPGDYVLKASTAFALFCDAPKAETARSRALQVEFSA